MPTGQDCGHVGARSAEWFAGAMGPVEVGRNQVSASDVDAEMRVNAARGEVIESEVSSGVVRGTPSASVTSSP